MSGDELREVKHYPVIDLEATTDDGGETCARRSDSMPCAFESSEPSLLAETEGVEDRRQQRWQLPANALVRCRRV